MRLYTREFSRVVVLLALGIPLFSFAQSDCSPTPLACPPGQIQYYVSSNSECPKGGFTCAPRIEPPQPARSAADETQAPAATSPEPQKPSAVAAPKPRDPLTLSMGAQGGAVSTLQSQLIKLGFLDASNATGYFGALTRDALRAFQRSRGIVSSGDEDSTGYGLAGPRTRAELLSAITALGSARTNTLQITGASAPNVQTNQSTANAAVTSNAQIGSSNPDVSSLVQSLLAQIKALQDQIAKLTAPANVNSANPTVNPSATAAQPHSCIFNGQTVASGSSVVAYQSPSVASWQACSSEVRTCIDGNLSGSWVHPACSIVQAATQAAQQQNALRSCSWNGGTVENGSSVTAYQSSSVAYGAACVSQTRTCSDGALGGSFANASCAPAAAQPCSFNGSVVAHGQSVTAYQSPSVAAGASCASEQRTCSNGALSGSYANPSCSVAAPATPTTPAPTAVAASGGSQNFTTPGTYTFTIPAYNMLTVVVKGAGGGFTAMCRAFQPAADAANGNESRFTVGTLTPLIAGGGKGGSSNSCGMDYMIFGSAGDASGGDINTSGGGAAGYVYVYSAGGWTQTFGGAGGLAQKTYSTEQLPVGSTATVVVGAGGHGLTGLGQDGSVSITWAGTQSSAADRNANLANALTALEQALTALLTKIPR